MLLGVGQTCAAGGNPRPLGPQNLRFVVTVVDLQGQSRWVGVETTEPAGVSTLVGHQSLTEVSPVYQSQLF